MKTHLECRTFFPAFNPTGSNRNLTPVFTVISVLLTLLAPLSLVAQNPLAAKTETLIQQPVFEVSALDNKFILAHWSAAAACNFENYTVERSSDGVRFEAVIQMNAEQVTGKTTNYSFIDEHPVYGVSYYRLKMTGNDQMVYHSPIVSIQLSKLEFNVFPNPASGNSFVTVSIKDLRSPEVVLQLFDMNGNRVLFKKIMTTDGQNGVQLSLDGIPAGVYTLTFSSETFFEFQTLSVQ